MDAVFDAQYLAMKNSFSREGIDIQIAYTPTGDVNYIYVADQLLTVDRGDNIERLMGALRGLRHVDVDDQPRVGDLVLLSTADIEDGRLTVPEALDLIDERLGDDNPALRGGEPLATPVHVVHIAKICPADEPEVPGYCQTGPCPPPCPAVEGQHRVRLGISDTGLLEDLDFVQAPWLAGVTGEADPLGSVLPGGLRAIRQYEGHGTFVAGVARCMAPGVTAFVSNHFTKSGGELEYVIIEKLEQLIADQRPEIVNLSAGTYTRNNWVPLSFSEFGRRHSEITLVAAAGNDSTDREFWPAAFPWVVSVGALGADQRHRAWFSNYGDWVDVYALGEGMVNAFATGVYTYQEPPKRPAMQTFDGLARWDGTSFSTPLVAGLIAATMARSGVSAAAAAEALLGKATAQRIRGVGPALFPCDVV
jgi:subtilisin family serine protease